ncbi:hypothetical protein V6W80_11820 [Pseudomonas benzopyrenica]|uniref:Uncharacterized protein n=1 Tax=Pseudomonas benzopyrenica TaxID=2993566 RepID=A0ABZ2FVP3_9PSED
MDSNQIPESLYLYGEVEFLGKFVGLRKFPADNRGLRFCDILHYKGMENLDVRDDETVRAFELHKDFFTININGIDIDPSSMAGHTKLKATTPRCFCLCLSMLPDSDHMYRKFKADMCLKVDVANLLEFLNEKVAVKHKGLVILNRPITYFPAVVMTAPPTNDGLIFWKSNKFSDEEEYRIAIKTPPQYVIASGQQYQMFHATNPSYMFIGHKDKALWTEIFPEFSLKADRGFQRNRI